MACSCTEEFETIGNAIIGRNKVECIECKNLREIAEAERAINNEIQEKKLYLASTDYQVIRQVEQSTMSAEDYATLLAARQLARTRINELQA